MRLYDLSKRAAPSLLPEEEGNRTIHVYAQGSVEFIKSSCERRGLQPSVAKRDGFHITVFCTKARFEEIRAEFNTRKL